VKHAWIRYSGDRAGNAADVKTLRMTDAAAAALAERTNATTTWHRDGQRRELVSMWVPRAAWPGVDYVRMEPSTPGGRQARDQLLGAELVRRFDLTPHITVHLADGVTLWTSGDRDSQTAEAWDARNMACPTACGTYVVGTHASNDFNEVTCKACRAGRRCWLRFSTKHRAERFAPVVEALTDQEITALWRPNFRRMVTCQRELVYFELGDGDVQTHYVLLEPKTQSGWRERDHVLGDEYVQKFINEAQGALA
jgi:hypothetical protein